MSLFIFKNMYYNKKDNKEIEFNMSSEDKNNPITFIQKEKGKRPIPILLIPQYLGKQISTKKFLYWYDRDNPMFRVYPNQKYDLKKFPRKEFVFLPYIKTIKRSVQLIMKIKDSYNNDIMLDEDNIYIKSYNTIQIDKNYAMKYKNNHLHIICKLNPMLIEINDEVKSAVSENRNRIFGFTENTQQNMVTNNKEVIKDNQIININTIDNTKNNSEILKEFLEQEIDLPIQLMEVLMLGISAKARSSNVVQIEVRTGSSYIINPYLERYELALKKVIDSHFTNQQSIGRRDVSTKGFI